tara:strand:- start:471 stop:1112 length:642 start_codon:yes stop_codon:yes gene_type:complete
MSDTGSTFSAIVQQLLAGNVICEASNEHLFRYLQDDQNLADIRQYLHRVNRSVRETTDGKAYLCCYSDPNETEAKQAIREQFRLLAGDLESLVKWLRLVMSCTSAGRPIVSGDILQEAELISAIASSPVQAADLDELCKAGLFKSAASDGKGKIRQITEKLRQDGYLIPRGKSGASFLATGKWSWLYDTMEFIQMHEALDEDEAGKSDQMGLI